jgi:hypothetical protein
MELLEEEVDLLLGFVFKDQFFILDSMLAVFFLYPESGDDHGDVVEFEGFLIECSCIIADP